MPKCFSQELYFCHSRVRALKFTFAVFAVVSWYLGSIGTLSGSSFINFASINSSDGWKGQSEVLRKAGLLSHVLSKNSFCRQATGPCVGRIVDCLYMDPCIHCRQLKYLGTSIGDEHWLFVNGIVVQWCCLSTLTFARQLG